MAEAMIIAVGTSLAPHAGTLALQACSTIMTTLSVALANRLGAAVFAEKACEKLPSGEAEEYKLSKLSIKTIVDSVASVVKAELKEQLFIQSLSQAQSRLDGIMSQLSNTYPNLGGTAAERDREIMNYEQSLVLGVLGPLSIELGDSLDAKLLCLPAFMVAAAVHMAIIQERANLAPKAAGRKNTLRIHAEKYSAYAEDIYKRGFQMRMEQISEVRQDMPCKFWGMKLSGADDNYFFVDKASELDSKRQQVQYHIKNKDEYYPGGKKQWVEDHQKGYLDHAQRCFEFSLSRNAMLATFQAWAAECPGFIGDKHFQPPSVYEEDRAYLELQTIRFEIDPSAPEAKQLLQGGEIFGLQAQGSIYTQFCKLSIDHKAVVLQGQHSVAENTLIFLQPLTISFHVDGICNRPEEESVVKGRLKIYILQWCAKWKEWKTVGTLWQPGVASSLIGKVVDGKLTANKMAVEQEIGHSGGSQAIGVLHYTAAHIHFLTTSS